MFVTLHNREVFAMRPLGYFYVRKIYGHISR